MVVVDEGRAGTPAASRWSVLMLAMRRGVGGRVAARGVTDEGEVSAWEAM